MRHLKATKKFKRTEEERRRLLRDLARGLILDKQITTFTTRAKYFRPFFERLVTLTKRALLANDKVLAYRRLNVYFDPATSKEMIENVVPKLMDRNGGYTQQYKLFIEFSTLDRSVVRITQ
jgi:large subunit ribosomal protein L17